MFHVKQHFNKKLQRIVKYDSDLANDKNLDNNNIMKIIRISFFFKIIKLISLILTLSYFIGIFWYIFCDLTKDFDEDDENFMIHFDL